MIHAKIRDSVLLEIPGAGHSVHIEKQSIIVRSILNFLGGKC